MTTSTVETPRVAGLGAAVVPLLALAVFINYVDRGNLATAAPLIKDELHLSATQIGVLLSAFFWTYMPFLVVAGWLAEKINAYKTLALGVVIWSLATAASGLATGFMGLLVLRLVLGIGESAAFPTSSKLLAQHLPQHKLGAANGLIGAGLALGPAFGTLVGGLLMAAIGWRHVYVLFGLVSLLWLIPWWFSTRHASAIATKEVSEPAPPMLDILKRRELWGAGLGHFATNYAFYFVISWLPLYLVKAKGFTVPHMAQIGAMIYVAYAASSITTGWLSDRWVASGATPNLVRKTVTTASHLGAALSMMVCAFGDPSLSVPSLFVAGVAFGFNTPTIFAIGQTLAGPRAAGVWIGLQNCMGNFAGILAPIITGMVVDRTGQFYWAFIVAAAISLTGPIWWSVVIPKIAPLTWSTSRPNN